MAEYKSPESSFTDDLSFSFDDSPTAGNKDDDCTNIEMMEKLKTQYSDVSKEYRRYVISEILVDCYKDISEHPNLVPEALRDKVKSMVRNMSVLESITKTDQSGNKCYLYGFNEEDLLELQSEVLSPEEELCLKTAVKRMLKQKCKAFQDKQSEIEKECKMLKLNKKTDGSSGSLLGRVNENIKAIDEIAEKMKECNSLMQSISKLQQKCVEEDAKLKDVALKACDIFEAKIHLLNAESGCLNSKTTEMICSENEDFVKAVEIGRSALQEKVQEKEQELKALNEKLQEYETAEQDPKYKDIVKKYKKILQKQAHLNWCFESMQEK